MATNHFTDFLNLPKVAIFNPEVTEKTGISSFSLIEMVVKKLKPSMIIMIDSLATSNKDYLNNCIEINNTGIIPGSAIKDNKRIDENTFGIPVIAIGVPLALEIGRDMYSTPNVGEVIDVVSNIGILIAIYFINKIMFAYFLLMLLIIFILEHIRMKKYFELDKKRRKLSEKNTGLVSELIRGTRDIKSLNIENNFLKKCKC